MATIIINDDVKQRLKIKSDELGVEQTDLLNKYVIEGIERDTTPKKAPSIEEIKKLLDYDLPGGDHASKNLIDIADCEFETNAVQLKKQSYHR